MLRKLKFCISCAISDYFLIIQYLYEETLFWPKLSGCPNDDWIYLWVKFQVKTPLFVFWLNIEKPAKKSVKSSELGSKGLTAQIFLGLF